MANSPGRPHDVGRVAHACWWLGALLSVEAVGFLIAAWGISIVGEATWGLVVPVPAAMFLAVAGVFGWELRKGTSAPSYEQLPYSWGAFAGMIGGSAVGSAGILGLNLALRETFYAQVSQVLPVLLLTFAVEQRFFTRLTHPDARADAQWAFGFVMVSAAVAEVLVLVSLASHADWLEWSATITTAMAVPASLALIGVSAFVNAFRLRAGEPGVFIEEPPA
jgi:hypothetical protein